MNDLVRLAALLLPALWLGGCSLLTAPDVQPTRYFVLTADTAPSLSTGTDSRPRVSLGVGPFTFPSYLDRPQMVTRDEPNQLSFSAFSRWAEPIQTGFLRVLAEDVGRVVGTNQVVVFPWYQIPLEYQVKGEVTRFETTTSGEAVLECVWTLYRLPDEKYLVTRQEKLRKPVETGNPDEVAAALSELVGELAQSIGRAILAQPAKGRT